MADFYKRKDVEALLKFHKILFIGDSNVRPLYKDLICALKQEYLINIETLKNPVIAPNVDSYYGDVALQQCGKKHEWAFWEHRLFEEGPWRIEMICTGRFMKNVLQQFIFKIPNSPYSTPDVVYLSYHDAYRRHTRFLVSAFLVNLKLNLPYKTLVLVGSSFSTMKDIFGDPRLDEVSFFPANPVSSDDDDARSELIEKVASLGFHFLDITYYLRKSVFRYDDFITNSLGNTLRITTPRRVNQELLRKAMSHDESDFYNSLLLKHANNWLGVKSSALTEQIDSAASNAYEVIPMLWKVHNRSSGWTATQKKSEAKCKNREVEHKESSPSFDSSKYADDSRQHSSYVSKEMPSVQENSSRSSTDVENDNSTARPSSKEVERFVSNRPKYDSREDYDAGSDQAVQNGDESLEEGEIEDSPSGSPKKQWRTEAEFKSTSNIDAISMLSAISSGSDEEYDSASTTSTKNERMPLLTRVPVCPQSLHYDPSTIQNYHTPVPDNPPAQIPCIDLSSDDLLSPIVLSDDEINPEESNNLCNDDDDDAIINFCSDESIDSLVSNDNKPNLEKPYESTHTKHEPDHLTRHSKHHLSKCKLKLMNAGGVLTNWPIGISRTAGSDRLWKWWRRFIEENDGSLVVHFPGMREIRTLIPRLDVGRGVYRIAVPKVIDDLQEFLNRLSCIEFTDQCIEDLANTQTRHAEEGKVKERSLLPLAEELSRGSIKKIHFEITQKEKPAIPSTESRITVKSFASVRNFTCATGLDASTSRGTRVGTSPTFYTYGEQPWDVTSSVCKNKYWSPLDSWVPANPICSAEGDENEK